MGQLLAELMFVWMFVPDNCPVWKALRYADTGTCLGVIKAKREDKLTIVTPIWTRVQTSDTSIEYKWFMVGKEYTARLLIWI